MERAGDTTRGLNFGVPMSENETCGSCRFWLSIWKLKSGDSDKKSSRGTCHRHAPQSSALSQSWPVTQADEWCGEYEPQKD